MSTLLGANALPVVLVLDLGLSEGPPRVDGDPSPIASVADRNLEQIHQRAGSWMRVAW